MVVHLERDWFIVIVRELLDEEIVAGQVSDVWQHR
jgi:hypothetical protein